MNPLKRTANVSLAFLALAAMTACSAGTEAAAHPTAGVMNSGHAPPPARVTTISVKAPKASLGIADITPMGEKSETIGVGSPIIVTFDKAVTDRAAAEAVLEVRSTKPAKGAWRWISERKVVYRTKTYWRPHQKVTFTGHLSQIPGNEGAKDVSRRFAIGAANIAVVDTRRHMMKVRRDGRLVKSIPISAGSGGMIRNGVDVYLTTSGVHLAMGKKRVETMTSGWLGITDPKDPLYYKLEIPWAVRISDSGEYVHQSAGAYRFLGKSNQSHGCVRATPSGAKWFYGIAQRGDVVKITGTKRKLDWRNGWSFWQLNWTQWKKGSALPPTSTTTDQDPLQS